MAFAQNRGRAGEALAAAYLEMVGCRILARNTRLAGVEVDLLVEDGGTQVLVEVRARSRPDYGGAAQSVDFRKRQRLLQAARAIEAGAGRVRIDVVALDVHADGVALTHFRSAVTG